MIVQLLAHYYDAMLKRGAISAPGWGPASISYAICLDLDGNVLIYIDRLRKLPLAIRLRLSLRL